MTNDKIKTSSDSSDFVLVNEVIPDAIIDVRYYSNYNFVGKRISGYEENCALLTKEATNALKKVSEDLNSKGYRLKIFDAYRPLVAGENFTNWAKDVENNHMKEIFYPDLEKELLFEKGYIAELSSHSRGSTIDLTLFDINKKQDVDMGGTFDYFSELSHSDYKGITEEQYNNRMILQKAMILHGFKPLKEEWWHFTLENEPFPDTYFTFPVNSNVVK